MAGLSSESLFVKTRDHERRNPPPIDASDLPPEQVEAFLAKLER